MAILVRNGVPLNLTEGTTEIEKEIRGDIAYIAQKRKTPLIVINPRPHRKDNNGRAISKSPTSKALVAKRIENGIEVQYVYCDTQKIKGDKTVYPPKLLVCNNTLTVPTDMSELIWFITKLNGLKGSKMKIYDEESEAKARVNKDLIEYHVREVVYGNRLSKKEIRELGMGMGIPKSDTMAFELLQVSIIDKVTESEKNKNRTKYGYEEFLKDANEMGENVELKALIQKAVDEKVISFDDKKSICFYSGTDNVICRIAPSEWAVKERTVLNKLLSDKDKREAFDSAMEGKGLYSPEEENSIENLIYKTRNELLLIAKKEHGLDFSATATKKVIISKIEKALEGSV